MGLEPTASLVLSQSGLPIAYRAFDSGNGVYVLQSFAIVEYRGIEPRSSACNTDVFPLDERPMCFVFEEVAQLLLVRLFPKFSSVPRAGIEPANTRV